MIWAIDQDDDRLTALESLTGKDIDPSFGLSPTSDEDQWNLSQCLYTKCGDVCPDGWKTMTDLNEDADGNACNWAINQITGFYNPQRRFCCPPWGAPDPKVCHWSDGCYSDCGVGEVCAFPPAHFPLSYFPVVANNPVPDHHGARQPRQPGRLYLPFWTARILLPFRFGPHGFAVQC
jgi:hypothetical protein